MSNSRKQLAPGTKGFKPLFSFEFENGYNPSNDSAGQPVYGQQPNSTFFSYTHQSNGVTIEITAPHGSVLTVDGVQVNTDQPNNQPPLKRL
jgi:hypothetical protein